MHSYLKDQFINPPDEFTPIPLWFWNDRLEASEILRQINDFYNKGVSGFIIHPRIGIPESIPFLSEEYLNFMEIAIKEADKRSMIVFLYDEAMYPSGSAHGQVVGENPELASKGIKVFEFPATADCELLQLIDKSVSSSVNAKPVSVQIVRKISTSEIDAASVLVVARDEWKNKALGNFDFDEGWSVLVFVQADTGGVIRGIHFGEDAHEEGAPLYPDVLNPVTANKYMNIVHETFFKRFSKYFGRSIKAIFTDEPRPLAKRSPLCFKPWTDGFLKYLEEHGFNERQLSLLWYESGCCTSKIRKQFDKLVKKRLGEVFYKPISDWCVNHGISLTGHPMEADDIELEKYFQIPGQDMVFRKVEPGKPSALEGQESTQAKCSSDAARHLCRRRNLNECFGAYGWELTMDEMKWILDWLFVRGVNMITPHAFYYSVKGERYFERPPDVGPNNSWWLNYKNISDYIKRLSWLMTDSINQAQVAVLCEGDYLPWEPAGILFTNQIEFNYLQDEIFLSEECRICNGVVRVKNQVYRTIVVDDRLDIRPEIKDKLDDYIRQGGSVIGFSVSDCEMKLVGSVKKVCTELIEMHPPNKDLRISHVKKEDMDFYLLVNEGEEAINGQIILNCSGNPEIWNPWNSDISELERVNLLADEEQPPVAKSFPVVLNRRESIIYTQKGKA